MPPSAGNPAVRSGGFGLIKRRISESLDITDTQSSAAGNVRTVAIRRMAKLTMAGSYVAIITPFTESDEVDYAKLEELVEWHIAEGYAIMLRRDLV